MHVLDNGRKEICLVLLCVADFSSSKLQFIIFSCRIWKNVLERRIFMFFVEVVHGVKYNRGGVTLYEKE